MKFNKNSKRTRIVEYLTRHGYVIEPSNDRLYVIVKKHLNLKTLAVLGSFNKDMLIREANKEC